jgi:hypothetical protein
MSRFHFGIGGAPVGNMLVVEQLECLNGNLVNFAWKAADPGLRRQFVETAHAVVTCGKPDEHSLHGGASLS